jgi:hypothetical protein
VADENVLDTVGLLDTVVKRKDVATRQTENVPDSFRLHDLYDGLARGQFCHSLVPRVEAASGSS